MGQPVVVLAGQSNASRVSDEIVDELDALYGAGGLCAGSGLFGGGAADAGAR